ncbi:hypothetical protein RvY_17423 [Ramazzottius varieornatus]|uniref:Uncharacterized protein n=1 Tax=Ramazzottius varieornatus TaxID=947166 RepID=A0A1D1W2X5_RAMVA|nr:hypothetical protein RvY_17423 [Ramazzottius varieornatus]
MGITKRFTRSKEDRNIKHDFTYSCIHRHQQIPLLSGVQLVGRLRHTIIRIIPVPVLQHFDGTERVVHIFCETGSKDAEWKRAVVKQVHKRANQIHVGLVEYGFETVVIGEEKGKSILEDHYSKSERRRVFFACRFVLDGVDPTMLAEGFPAYNLLKDSVQGVEAVVRCSRREGRTAFGRMWIRPEDELYDLAAEIKKLSGSSK